MAKMPSDVQLIYNPMTAAPGFILNNVYVLPGVPKIMQVMFINVLKNIKKGKPKKKAYQWLPCSSLRMNRLNTIYLP